MISKCAPTNHYARSQHCLGEETAPIHGTCKLVSCLFCPGGEKIDKKPMVDPKEGQPVATTGIKRQTSDPKIPDPKRKRT